MNDLRATVVVPFRGTPEDLTPLIESLERQTMPRSKFEVVIGDDGSDHDLTGLNTEDGWLRISQGPPRNSYAARNRAAGRGNAPVIAFCDADCVPERDWLERGLAAVDAHPLVGGPIRWQVPAGPSIWSLLDIDLHVDHERTIRAGECLTGNLFVRREAFERLGGFDESLPSGGDGDFGRRATRVGMPPVFAEDVVVWHPTHDSRGSFLGKIRRIHWSAGARDGRRGVSRRRVTASTVPVLAMFRSRRVAAKPLRLDQRRLAAARVAPSLTQEMRALVVLYLLVPYVARVASRRGNREGLREARACKGTHQADARAR